MSPKEVLDLWLDAFNNADAEKSAALYSEYAVNQHVANEPVEGRQAIRAMFEREFSQATMVCIPKISLKTANGPFSSGPTRKACVDVVFFIFSITGSTFSAVTGTNYPSINCTIFR